MPSEPHQLLLKTNSAASQQLSTAELNALVLERVRKMTPEEKFKSLIASGIYTSAGELTREYSPVIVPAYGK